MKEENVVEPNPIGVCLKKKKTPPIGVFSDASFPRSGGGWRRAGHDRFTHAGDYVENTPSPFLLSPRDGARDAMLHVVAGSAPPATYSTEWLRRGRQRGVRVRW
jgi:hypothetical protein